MNKSWLEQQVQNEKLKKSTGREKRWHYPKRIVQGSYKRQIQVGFVGK
ncbi:hypothetical protein POV28_21145 [Escherichia coli]|nr:hypothetical protein [Escherichia coli]MDN2617754.1 hypothetical protein [Enterobacter kobei]MDO5958149.1 hypothetical protein [Escherichia coli]